MEPSPAVKQWAQRYRATVGEFGHDAPRSRRLRAEMIDGPETSGSPEGRRADDVAVARALADEIRRERQQMIPGNGGRGRIPERLARMIGDYRILLVKRGKDHRATRRIWVELSSFTAQPRDGAFDPEAAHRAIREAFGLPEYDEIRRSFVAEEMKSKAEADPVGSAILEAEQMAKPRCEECAMTFTTGQGLGAHNRHTHPGRTKTEKKAARKTRRSEIGLGRAAKALTSARSAGTDDVTVEIMEKLREKAVELRAQAAAIEERARRLDAAAAELVEIS